MIFQHPRGIQFQYRKNYGISLFYPEDAIRNIGELETFYVSYFEVAYFRYDTNGEREYLNPHSDFSSEGKYLGKGEIVYDDLGKFYTDQKRFVEKFNLVP